MGSDYCPIANIREASIDSPRYVYWCKIQHQNSSVEVHISIFTDLKATFNFTCQEQHEDFIFIAHCSAHFDFQFLYKHYLASSVVHQGHQKEPLMKGQEISPATLIYHIQLLDSYSDVSEPLSLPAIF